MSKPIESAEDFTCTILSDHGGHDVEQHDYEAVQALIESRDNAVRLAAKLELIEELGQMDEQAGQLLHAYQAVVRLRAKYSKPQP